MRLKIAAKIASADAKYFHEEIEPLLKESKAFVDFIGEVGGKEKDEFLGNAYALLFPIDWPEPFGLVMIEAMACGTPVVGYRRGSVPEIMEDGVTGFVVDSLEKAVEAVARVGTLSRSKCRQVFEKRFTAARMARDYLAVYHRLVELKKGKTRKSRPVERFVSRPVNKGQRARLDPDCLGVWPV
jgi:glycosyltransferase involved in cell wall biosynthesis